MNKAYIFVPDDLDLIDEPESAQIVPQLLLGHAFVETPKIDVPARVALANGECNLGGDG